MYNPRPCSICTIITFVHGCRFVSVFMSDVRDAYAHTQHLTLDAARVRMRTLKNPYIASYIAKGCHTLPSTSGLRQVGMATAAASGYDCKFAGPRAPPDELETTCPICMLILREPHQVQCCGKIYCQSCITTALSGGKPCPTCKAERPRHWLDKNTKQKLSGLHVFCPHRAEDAGDGIATGRGRKKRETSGCDWKGELCSLDKHVNANPRPEERFKGCHYTLLDCGLCQEAILRQKLRAHQQNECPERPYKCKYCSYKDSYSKVTKEHSPTCPKESICCQHCNKPFERQEIDNHVTNECELVSVPCDFSIVGCEVKLARKEVSPHLKGAIESHVTLLHKYIKSCPKPTRECLSLFASCLEQLVEEKQQIHRDLIQICDKMGDILKCALEELSRRVERDRHVVLAKAVTREELRLNIHYCREFTCSSLAEEENKRKECNENMQKQGVAFGIILAFIVLVVASVMMQHMMAKNHLT